MLHPINIAIEGLINEVIVLQLLNHVGLTPGLIRGRSGKHQLLQNLSQFNQAAKFANWLVIVDLDEDADCAPNYLKDILPVPSERMRLRVCVRAIESWLLADRENLAQYLKISPARIPYEPEAESDPKTTFINLARRSRSKALREDIVPRPDSGGQEGPGYVARIIEFVTSSEHQWRPEVASKSSESLRRCIAALELWKKTQS